MECRFLFLCRKILTLKCPRCEAAFYDFDGCFALTCQRCSAGFCAYCLNDCGNDAHQHVADCPHSLHPGDVYGRFKDFTEVQRQRRQRMVREYLATIGDASVRQRVIKACKCDFADHGICLTDDPKYGIWDG